MAEIGSDISRAARVLESEELVGIPTETVYGLAGNAQSETAITSIFATKNRPRFDPLIAHVGSIEAAHRIVHQVPEPLLALMEAFWPGPLTVLLEKRDNIPDLMTSGSSRVAVRMPRHPLTLELLTAIPFPLAAPSANPFGYVSPTTAQHVADQLGERIPYILDGGPCQVGVESTIVGLEEGQLTVYRLGGIELEALRPFGEFRMLLNQSSNPSAPGMIKSHYAPGVPVIIGNLAELVPEYRDGSVGIIAFQQSFPDVPNAHTLSLAGSLSEAAAKLFATLRALDRSGVELILAERFPDTGLGRAINDRLNRAAAR